MGIDAEATFERLRSTPNVTNVAVRDVARRVVEMASTEKCLAAAVIALRVREHAAVSEFI